MNYLEFPYATGFLSFKGFGMALEIWVGIALEENLWLFMYLICVVLMEFNRCTGTLSSVLHDLWNSIVPVQYVFSVYVVNVYRKLKASINFFVHNVYPT